VSPVLVQRGQTKGRLSFEAGLSSLLANPATLLLLRPVNQATLAKLLQGLQDGYPVALTQPPRLQFVAVRRALTQSVVAIDRVTRDSEGFHCSLDFDTSHHIASLPFTSTERPARDGL
jgi:hypothetical protein